MPLSAGTAVNQVTGSLAIQGKDGAGTLRYLPFTAIQTDISRGDSIMPLVNNAAYAVNKVKGSALGSIAVDTFLFNGLTNADFFNAAVGNGAGDTGASGYNVVTIRSNNQGGPGAETYAKAKFAGLSGSVRFSNNGGANACRLSLRLTSTDPLSSTTALAAPSSGALSTVGILDFAQAGFTGASSVAAVSWSLDTGLQTIPGVVVGGNSAYPSLPAGLLQTILGGSLTITQIKGAATVPGSSGADATFVLSLGTTGAGISFTFECAPMTTSLPVNVGIGYQSVTLALKSVTGTDCPFLATDL